MEKEILQRVLAERLAEVSSDIAEIVATGKYPVVVLLRGYGLLELVQDYFAQGNFTQSAFAQGNGVEPETLAQDSGIEPKAADSHIQEELKGALSGYKKVYEEYGQRLMHVLDRDEIAGKAEAYMRPWQRKAEKADAEYKKAVELWEAAKVAHKAQEEGGFFEKRRTLRAVRKLAGFKLERRRTGNFVARTLELMHQAQFAAREAELQMYAHNVGYKCNPDVYRKIYETIY